MMPGDAALIFGLLSTERIAVKTEVWAPGGKVRNRYRKTVIIAFVLASAFSLQAQSEGNDARRMDNFQPQGHSVYVLLAARFDESPANSAVTP